MQQQTEQDISRDGNSLEIALKALWEKARLSSSLILTLKEQNASLQLKIDDLERDITKLRNEGLVKNIEVDQVREELHRLSSLSKSDEVLFKEEKARIQGRIKVLIEKIDTHI